VSDLYDSDILTWSERQADLLRRIARGEPHNEAPDWLNIAEEIESVGQSERRRLRSHIATVIEHLIKLQASPATEPRIGWKVSILKARQGIERSLEATPSLKPEVAAMISDETRRERKAVAETLAIFGEQPRVDIASLTFTEDRVLGGWLPD
jgi:hypothetical protein